LNSPCYETPKNKNAIKKNRTKQPREKPKNKTDGKKATFVVMSLDAFFEKKKSDEKKFFVFLTPLVAKRPKNTI
jgi:hypothetical protein